MKYTKIVFLLFIIIQTDLIESFSKREQISYVNYSLISIEEETENELAQESSSFDSDGFNEIATNIVTLLGKIKKVVGLFNKSNDLTRDLTAAQKECNQAEELLMDKPYLSTNITSTNILRVIKDIITRYLFLYRLL